jgi:hypothetical protein
MQCSNWPITLQAKVIKVWTAGSGPARKKSDEGYGIPHVDAPLSKGSRKRGLVVPVGKCCKYTVATATTSSSNLYMYA